MMRKWIATLLILSSISQFAFALEKRIVDFDETVDQFYVDQGFVVNRSGTQVSVLTLDGDVVIPPYRQSVKIYGDYILVQRKEGFGVLNRSGHLIVPFDYSYGMNIVGSIACLEYDGVKSLEYGGTIMRAIDLTTGKSILPDEFDFINVLDEGETLVGVTHIDDRAVARLYNRSGKLIADGDIIRIGDYKNERALCVDNKSQRIGLMDTDGSVIISPEYSEITSVFSNLYITNKDEEYELIGHDGKHVSKKKYLKVFSNFKDYLALGNQDGLDVYYPDGRNIHLPLEGFGACGEVIYTMDKKGKLGGIDRFGNVIVPFLYEKGLALEYFSSLGKSNSDHVVLYNQLGQKIMNAKENELDSADHAFMTLTHENQTALLNQFGREIYRTNREISWIDYSQSGYISIWFQDGYDFINLDGDKIYDSSLYPLLSFHEYNGAVSVVAAHDGALWKMDSLPIYASTPSKWARGEVKEACDAGRIPQNLQREFREKCTRERFCELMVGMLNVKNSNFTDTDRFQDTESKAVAVAHQLGLVNGFSDRRFYPHSYITRQDAAVILARAVKVYHLTGGEDSSYCDEAKIAPYARRAVTTVSPWMSGYDGKFDPRGQFTVEQAMVTIYRMTKEASR